MKHHIHRVEALVVARQHLHHLLGELGIDVGPKVNDLVIAFIGTHEAHLLELTDFGSLRVGVSDKPALLLRHQDVAQVERQTTFISLIVTHVLDIVKELGRYSSTFYPHHVANDGTKRLLGQQFVNEAVVIRNDLVEDDATHGSFDEFRNKFVLITHLDANLNDSVHIGATFIMGNNHLFRRIERHAFALHRVLRRALTRLCDIVQTQNHVLRRQRDRCSVRGVQDVVRSQHQNLSFQYSCIAQRHVNSHLVAVEVSVECRTYKRVQTDCLTFDKFRLEGLDTQTVQRRSTVQQNRVTFQDVFKDVPYDRILAVDNLLGRLHGLDDAALDELADHERLEQLGGHVLRQTAFVHIQVGTDHDDRTARVVNTFTEQVLTESTLLTFQAVAQRLERTVGVGLHSA